jgi:hypothetical protein
MPERPFAQDDIEGGPHPLAGWHRSDHSRLGNAFGVGAEVASALAGVTKAGGGRAGECRRLRVSTRKTWTRTGTYCKRRHAQVEPAAGER